MSKFEEVKSFVLAWESSGSLEEASKATGKSKAACQQAARMLRKKGVGLKKFGASTGVLTEKQYEELALLVSGQLQLPGIASQIKNDTPKKGEVKK